MNGPSKFYRETNLSLQNYFEEGLCLLAKGNYFHFYQFRENTEKRQELQRLCISGPSVPGSKIARFKKVMINREENFFQQLQLLFKKCV